MVKGERGMGGEKWLKVRGCGGRKVVEGEGVWWEKSGQR